MSKRARWLLLAPALLGAALGGLVVAVAVHPTWQRLQAQEAELADLHQRQQLLPLVRQQLLREIHNRERAEGLRRVLLTMVTGNGNPNTLMAAIGRLAQARGVTVTLYEPKAAAPQAGDPLAMEGLERRELLVSAQGTFPALLAFLRDLERLQMLMVQSNLEISLTKTDQDKPRALNPVTLKLAVVLYGRPAMDGRPAPTTNRRPSRPHPARPADEPE